MAETIITNELLVLLRKLDTPTVCNAIEVAQGKRGFNRFTRGTMQHSRPGEPAIVGFARTAKISGLAPPVEPSDVIRSRRMDYFRSMASGDGPTVSVVEDVDFPNCIAGWWGEVHVAVHKGLGMSGAVTNGVMRDLDVMDDGFSSSRGFCWAKPRLRTRAQNRRTSGRDEHESASGGSNPRGSSRRPSNPNGRHRRPEESH